MTLPAPYITLAFPLTLYKSLFNLHKNLRFHSFLFSFNCQMEAFGVLKFWWNSATGADVASYAGDWRRPAFGTDDDEETDADDSFFDLVFTSPGDVTKKDFQFIESPRDVFVRKNDFSDSNRVYPVNLLRSTPKFKILMLGFRKSPKFEKSESNGEIKGTPVNQCSKSSPVTCSVKQMPGACSLRSQLMKETSDCETWPEKLSKGSVPKYLKLIKPLYLKVWRRNEKTKFTGSVTPPASPVTAPVDLSPRKSSESSRMGNFRIASKRLRKSRSASAAVGVAPLPVHRRDDSLLERNDGIQNAVLYCKKSYNSSSKEFSQQFQTSTDPSVGGSLSHEPKRCSI